MTPIDPMLPVPAPFAPKGEAASMRPERALAYLQDMAERGCEGGWKDGLICRDIWDGDAQLDIEEYCDPCRAQAVLLNERAAPSAPPPPEPVVLCNACKYQHAIWCVQCADKLSAAALDRDAKEVLAPEPVVRWCLKQRDNNYLRAHPMFHSSEDGEAWVKRFDMAERCTVVRVEITERPE